MDLLASLNERQIEAVTTTEGYVRVVAGAGSGKTRALTHRYAFLVEELGVATENILCVTFTNKAAGEMRMRIRKLIGDHDTGFVCTFHGFCVKELREDIHLLGYPKNFVIIDEDDQNTILKSVYEERKIDPRTYPMSVARDMICARKADMEYIKLVTEDNNRGLLDLYNGSTRQEDVIFYGYLFEQKKNYSLDFEDLINFSLRILIDHEEVRRYWQMKMQYVMVDEFQDVSHKQYLLADILSDYNKNLFVVGDPDQTIYSWRGADVKIFLLFPQNHENTTTIVMDSNYRSKAHIIYGSNSLIEKNNNRFEKELHPVKSDASEILYFHADNPTEEAEWIASKIAELQNDGIPYEDMAVLYRSHHISRPVEEILVKQKVPYVIYSGVAFYSRKEIKDIICYLRMLTGGDDLAFLRTINEPSRNIGKTRIAFLEEYAKDNKCSLLDALKANIKHDKFKKTGAAEYLALLEKYGHRYSGMKISDVLEHILVESGYEEMLKVNGEDERLDNLAELKQSMIEYENSAHEETFLEEYLQSIALFTNMDKELRKHCVKLMTIHASKGLEFPNVFVCGMSEGLFPSGRTEDYDGMEEERRLAYVALTRAEERLFLSDAEGITFSGETRCPSRFIFNIDEKYITYVREIEEEIKNQFLKRINDSEKLIKELNEPTIVEGTRVRHKHLGDGTVIGLDYEHKNYIIKFDKVATQRSIMMTAALEIIST